MFSVQEGMNLQPMRLFWVGDRVRIRSGHAFAFGMLGTVARLHGLGLAWIDVLLDASATSHGNPPLQPACLLTFHSSDLRITS